MNTTQTFITPAKLVNANVNVTVVGVGGTGSIVLSLLAQMNYLLRALSAGSSQLSVTAYDSDTVSPFNLGRQNFYPHDLNRHKSEVIIERLNQGFGTRWQASTRNYTPSSYQRHDVLLTCVDNIATRMAIGETFKAVECDSLWGDCGNDHTSGQVIFGHLGKPINSGKLPNWFDLYGERMDSVTESVTDSCSHEQALSKQDFGVNHQSALLLVQPLWQLLRHGKLRQSGAYFDVAQSDTTMLPIDAQTWATFGYCH